MDRKKLIAYALGLIQDIKARAFSDERPHDTDAETKTYSRWMDILNKEVSLDDLAAFLEREIRTLSTALKDAVKQNKDRDALLITARLETYEALVAFIRSPDKARDALIAELEAIHK